MNWGKLREPWVIRKIVYALAAVAGLVAVVTGVATPDAVDAWAPHIDALTSVALTIVGAVAAAKTSRGSDDPTRATDVAAMAADLAELRAAADRAAATAPAVVAPLLPTLDDIRDRLTDR